jgi:hypothetical protein
MNIIQRVLLSLKLRRALKRVGGVAPGEPGGTWVTCHADGTATVGGSGAVPGTYLTVTFSNGSTASTTVSASGAWQVVSGILDSCPLSGDLEIVTGDPSSVGVIDSIEITPDGSYLISGHGGRAGDVLTVTIAGERFELHLTGAGTWFFTVTPSVTPPDIGPGDGDVDSDYMPPYVISITPVGDGTYIVIGGGGKIGDTLNVIANEISYPVTVGSDGGWTAVVGVKDTEPGTPPDVEVEDPYVAPYIISVTNNQDGTYEITGGGGRAGDEITIFIEEESFEAIIETDNAWSVTIVYTRHVDIGDVEIIVSPKDLEGFVSAADAVYADVDGRVMVECADDGRYISWEFFFTAVKNFVSILTTPIAKFSLPDYNGFPKKTIKIGSTYVSVYDYKYVIYTSQDLVSGTERVVEKNYIFGRDCNAHKTNHTAYYWRRDGDFDRLTRYDGFDSGVVADIKAFGGNNLPMIVTLGDKDWVVNNTFSISVFINPVTMETTPGPVYGFSMACNGEAGCYTFNSNSAFFQNTSNSVIEFRSDGTTRDISRADYNNLASTDKYLFRMGGDKFTRLDLIDYESTEITGVPRSLGVRGVYVESETIISYSVDEVTGGSQVSLSHDAGNTWESFFLEAGLDKHLFTDVEDDELVVTLSSNVDNVVNFQLVEG